MHLFMILWQGCPPKVPLDRTHALILSVPQSITIPDMDMNICTKSSAAVIRDNPIKSPHSDGAMSTGCVLHLAAEFQAVKASLK